MSEVCLVEGGRAAASIVVSEQAGEVERFAAAELARYTAEMTGAGLDVAAQPAVGCIPLYVGLRSHLAAIGVDGLRGPAPGHDGYVLDVSPTRVAIAGDNERGVLYGVYDLLERFGCRWYVPQIDPSDPEIVPRIDRLALAPFSVAEASPFQYRVCHPSSMIYVLNVPDALAHVDWAAKARYNTMLFYFSGRASFDSAGAVMVPAQAMEETAADAGPAGGEPVLPTPEDFWLGTAEYETSGVAPAMRQRGMRLEGPNHGFLFFVPNDLFSKHPDWFGMRDGVRMPQGGLRPEFCWSNPDAVEHFCSEVVRWLEANPHIDVCNVIPNDGGKACECGRCSTSTPSDLYAALCNRMLDHIVSAGLDVEVEIAGGYDPVAEPPTSTPIDPRIRVHWAHWGRRHDDWYGGGDYTLRTNLDTWVDAGHPFTMVEYYTDSFASPPLMPPVARQMDADTAWLVERGVAGNLSLMYPHGAWWSASLNGWLAVSWYYQQRGAVSFLDDYCAHYFGAASEPMLALHRLLTDEMWLTYWAIGPRWCEPVWAPVDEAERAAPLLDRVAALLDDAAAAVGDDAVLRYRMSRPLAVWRVLVTLGRARVAATPLVHQAASASASVAARRDKVADAELLEGMRALYANELAVVRPAVEALWDHVGVIPRGFESDKLLQPQCLADLERAIAATAAAQAAREDMRTR